MRRGTFPNNIRMDYIVAKGICCLPNHMTCMKLVLCVVAYHSTNFFYKKMFLGLSLEITFLEVLLQMNLVDAQIRH